MSELTSVGLDVGTTTTQLIVSRLTVENRASAFQVPEMHISGRQITYRSPVHFTPLAQEKLVDGDALRRLVEQEYAAAGITPAQVDTGAVIITGETSRKENAGAVLEALSSLAGDFVVASAGPSLESRLAAQGAEADTLSRQTGKTVLHMDIGGGTANLARIENGVIVQTGCMNVGGRLIKVTAGGTVSYVSPVLQELTQLQPGDYPAPGQLEGIAGILVCALEMAAGLRPPTALLKKLWTAECGPVWPIQKAELISFSGGVADCIEGDFRPGAFGDMGVELGQAIRKSLLCQGDFRLGAQTIRATVIGAGCHSAQLSGSTVFCRNVTLPVKNLPVVALDAEPSRLKQQLHQRLSQLDEDAAVLALPGADMGYEALSRLAEALSACQEGKPLYICTQGDIAKALGQKLALLLPEAGILCIDRIQTGPDSYLDIGAPVGPCFPVVVKTLVLGKG